MTPSGTQVEARWPVILALVASGGAVGAMARVGLERLVETMGGPGLGGLLVVNVLGSFLLGWIFTRLDPRAPRLVDIELPVTDLPGGGAGRRFSAAALAVGFCGAFTSYSGLAGELLSLWRIGRWSEAAAWTVAMLALGLGGLVGGVRAGRFGRRGVGS